VLILEYHINFKPLTVIKNTFYKAFVRGFILPVFCTFSLVANSNQRIAVVYPESSARVNQMYSRIITNMQQHDSVDIQSRSFSIKDSAPDIQQWISEQKSQAVIFLGKKGLRFSLKLSLDIPVITGAHVGVLSSRSAVSLTAEPEQLFHQLKSLKPNIKTVYVIYNETNSGWLIKKAKLAAKKNQLKLNAIETDTIQASGLALKNTLQNIDTHNSAIWLPHDPILPIKPLLPDLLKKSWQSNLILFSSNPYHVQQGVLFALFPDYSKLGKQLLDLALNKINNNSPVQFQASRYLNSAINIRTASHLGIQLSNVQKKHYKMVFPKK
jgi:ABC-type uncharacterized transport system substrate-binding protein